MFKNKKMLKTIAKSKWFDLLGVLIVIFCAWKQGYISENLSQVTKVVHSWPAWSVFVPFGIISTIASIISLMSDRLQARVKNLGNWLGLIAVVTSGIVDYLLGDKSAPFTYPITFILQMWAIKTWMNSDRYKANPAPKGWKAVLESIGTIVVSFVISYATNITGFGATRNALFYLTVVVFTLSLCANFFNALKLTEQWPFWIVYNVVQLSKAVVQGNWSNVGKYIYYLINSSTAILLWTDDGSKKTTANRHNGKVAVAKA